MGALVKTPTDFCMLIRQALKTIVLLVDSSPHFLLFCSSLFCNSIYSIQLLHSFSATVGSKISPPSWWSEEFWDSPNITSLPPPNIIIDTLVFRFSKSKIADLKSHNLHETSKAAALIKNKGTDTTCFVLEVCKRQGNNILCAICQV